MWASTISTITRLVLLTLWSVNRFAGTRLEDLAGEISSLCKDQHGCRYLQKKLEEGVPEHRDMIFRETFGHFADLMTGKRPSHCPMNYSKCCSQIRSVITSVRNCWSIPPMSSETSFASPSRKTLLIFLSTCTGRGQFKK
jgi:hypothetical protein